MALTITKVTEGRWVNGNKDEGYFDVTFDDSYPAGGEAVTPANFGLTKIVQIDPGISTNGYIVNFISSTSKLKVWNCDYSTATDGPLQENATTDLSAEIVRLRVVGR
jgi:hypothetical protein